MNTENSESSKPGSTIVPRDSVAESSATEWRGTLSHQPSWVLRPNATSKSVMAGISIAIEVKP